MAHTTIVSTDLLAAHLASWVVVDCRFDPTDEQWGRQQYQQAHVPGAVYASLNDDLAGPRTGSNGRHPLPSVDALAATFSRLGIANARKWWSTTRTRAFTPAGCGGR